jgi:hypothetical protein
MKQRKHHILKLAWPEQPGQCFSIGQDGTAEARKAMAEAVKMEPDNPEYNFGMGTISSFA